MSHLVVCRSEAGDAVIDAVVEVAQVHTLSDDARLLLLADDEEAQDGRSLTMIWDFGRRNRAEAFVSALARDPRTLAVETRMLRRRPPIAAQMPLLFVP